MPRLTQLTFVLIFLASAVAPLQPIRAAVVGFGNFSGFTINKADAGAPISVSIPAGSITLTKAGGGRRSIFTNERQSINKFTATYTYQANSIGFNFDALQGAAFVLQDSAAGPSAVGTNEALGYGQGASGIGRSVAIGIVLENQGFPKTKTTIGQNGTLTAPEPMSIDAYSGHPINVLISYNGTILHQELKDTITNQSWSADYFLGPSLSTIIGNSTAYVGFTAGTVSGANQTISNFRFVPEPSSFALAILGGLGALTVGIRRGSRVGQVPRT